jgi:hypothetical protein
LFPVGHVQSKRCKRCVCMFLFVVVVFVVGESLLLRGRHTNQLSICLANVLLLFTNINKRKLLGIHYHYEASAG